MTFKKERGSILLLFSARNTLEGICIAGATDKQTEPLRKFLRENFRGKQIIKLSGNPNPGEMKLEGWIKLHRQLLTNGWFRNHKVLVFWIYCLLKASHKPIKVTVGYQVIPLDAGQFIFGRKEASAETRLSEQEIRTCLFFLKSSKNLTLQVTNKFSIISIVNWERYQGGFERDQPANQPTNNQQ